MLNKNKSFVLSLIATVLLITSTAHAAPDTLLGSDVTLPGYTAYIPVNFISDGSVVGIQLEIQYDSSLVVAGTPTLDSQLNSEYRLASFEQNPGIRQIVIIPSRLDAFINSGDVVVIPFTMRPSTGTTASVRIHVTQNLLVDPYADLINPTKVVDGLVVHSGNTTSDTDLDGMLDSYEAAHNLLPLDASDVGLDPDADGLTNWQEAQVGSDPHSTDTDGDGMPDYYEYAQGLDPTNYNDANSDFDGDTLTNLEEYLFGSDINLADSDFDGLTDGEEYALNTNPNKADTDGDGVNDKDEVLAGTDPNLNIPAMMSIITNLLLD